MGNVLSEELHLLSDLHDLGEIKCRINDIALNHNIFTDEMPELDPAYLLRELKQISSARTIERTKYYINRLNKSLIEEKYTEINDLNLRKWKEYKDIITDSLWLIDKRDKSGAHNASYWGNFIPQIPNQLLRRYTKKNEWVLDTFLGSGTTLIECMRLGRKGIGIELQREAAELAGQNINNQNNGFAHTYFIVQGDSASLDYSSMLKERNISSVQFAFMHPPYWDIIKFSDDNRDLSNAPNVDEFLNRMGKIIENIYDVLDDNRYMALVIGDKYTNGELIPLGFLSMQEVLKRKFQLKSIIVKNFERTKGKQSQHELWRYRALKSGFYVFKHEYIFLFKKKSDSI